jgi:hypothetical protein
MTVLMGMGVPEWFSDAPVHGMAVADLNVTAPVRGENGTDAYVFHEYD